VNRLAVATVACFALGSGLLFPFDYTATIIAGVVLLLVFIVCGIFLVASPERLADE
jgi:hypothetical protein